MAAIYDALFYRYLSSRGIRADGKIDKQSVLYFERAAIGQGAGVKCMMFLRDTSECAILKPPAVDGDHGVCGFYVHGKATDSEAHPPMEAISATTAGYTEDGPTHCGNCRYYGGGVGVSGPCEKVKGTVRFAGCCNTWEEN